jgi:hypothetical protein
VTALHFATRAKYSATRTPAPILIILLQEFTHPSGMRIHLSLCRNKFC